MWRIFQCQKKTNQKFWVPGISLLGYTGLISHVRANKKQDLTRENTLTCSPTSKPISTYGDGDSGGSETSDTGVSGWICGDDHPNKVLDMFIFHLLLAIYSTSNLRAQTMSSMKNNLGPPPDQCF
jgi:hypothetical protein